MRVVYTEQLSFEQTPIEEVAIAPRSRDDIPAALRAIQHLYSNVPLREQVFTLLEEHILDRVDLADEEEQAAAAQVNPALGRRGADGFERMVGLAIVAANLHRIGLVLQRRERARLKAEREKRRRRLRRMAA